MVTRVLRAQVVWRLTRLCLYSVLMVLAGNVLLLSLPQVREALWSFDDGEGGEHRRAVFFVVAFVYWAVTAWYVSRLTLGRAFEQDVVGTPPDDPFTNTVARWLPRVLGLLAIVPIALFMWRLSTPRWLAPVLLAVSVLFLLVVWQRRKWFHVAPSEADLTSPRAAAPATGGPAPQPLGSSYRYFRAISLSGRRFLLLLAVIPLLVLLAIVGWPLDTGRLLGAPALLLLAIGAWLLAGGMVLSYWPRTRNWISLSWVPVLLVLVFAPFNDNHEVDGWARAASAPRAAAALTPDPRPALASHYRRWIGTHAVGEPVYLIAVAGGASRASYWAGVTLGRLEDEARRDGQRFGANIFALSAISGGSVGAAAFVAALKAWPADAPANPPQGIRGALDCFLGRDVLSPVGAMMLFPDALQRLLPAFGLSWRFDRSLGLEQSWAQDWVRSPHAPDHHLPAGAADLRLCPDAVRGENPWMQPLASLHEGAPWLPALLLNTARLEDGQPVVQSNLNLELTASVDLLAPALALRTQRISLVGAVHNSARFPYVSPPGTVHRLDGSVWGHLGDGGYHEPSGAFALHDMVERLQASGCVLRVRQSWWARPDCDPTTAHREAAALAADINAPLPAATSPVVFVLLDNTPANGLDGAQRDLSGAPRFASATAGDAQWPTSRLWLPEVLAPISGLTHALTHSSLLAERRLSELAGPDPHRFIELRLPRYLGRREPSMNWQLDRESRGDMMCATEPPERPTLPVLWVDKLAVDADPRRCGSADGYLPGDPMRAKNLADQALRQHLQRLRSLIQRGESRHAQRAAS